MFLSVNELFKIGIGPSSSHTMGPMIAARRFRDVVEEHAADAVAPAAIKVRLYGSLAFTGKGHATDRAVVLGLLGHLPDEVDPDCVEQYLQDQQRDGFIELPKAGKLRFAPADDIIFDYGPALPKHPNGMKYQAVDADGNNLIERVYYSIGGGFITSDTDDAPTPGPDDKNGKVPFPFSTVNEMLELGEQKGYTIAQMKRANEEQFCSREQLNENLKKIWQTMHDCIKRGLVQTGVLPGGLKVKRRAAVIYLKLRDEQSDTTKEPYTHFDWLHAYAMAVNEENAAGGRVVTAPTNGAAGVVPAVLKYYIEHCHTANEAGIFDYLLTAAAIGGIIKHNASISGAEMGCQGEVGSAAAMAAAGLCAAEGGTSAQIENAAEIALEHHLGMTCDPVAGLVQVPCIERNGMGAVKAVTACSLALKSDGRHVMPLDNCIAAMKEIGTDMASKYKETSKGGLAVNLPGC